MLNRDHGVGVVLTRGAFVTEAITARREDWNYQTSGSSSDYMIELAMRTYIFAKSAVVIDGDVIEPKIGDTITDGTEIFEIRPIDEGLQAVETVPGGYEWKVHVKKRGTV
jgi:hypothetical protein